MNNDDKAKVFDLIMSGKVTGMSKFWENFAKLQGRPHNEILSKMATFALEEAIEIVLSEE